MPTQTSSGVKTIITFLVIITLGTLLWLFVSNQRTAEQLRELRAQEASTTVSDTDSSFNETQLSQLQAQTDALEEKLTEADNNKLDNSSTTSTGTQPSTAQSAPGTPGLQGPQGPAGTAGATGPKGSSGATGAQGPAGQDGQDGSDGCLAGSCVSLQTTTPGTAETGHINITGTLRAGTLQGSGADITNVDAVYLGGYNAGHFTNASNLASGTVNDARLSNNIVKKDTANTLTDTLQLTAAGTALTVTNTASIGTLTVTNAATIGGNLTVAGAGSFTGSLTFGTTLSGTCQGLSGYVWVPGSAKYGTLPGFCVMQYEAKNNGSNVAVSTESGAPWVSINQRDARDRARQACAGCHLISEAEWMTIAENVSLVASNWSGGSVGSGCLFRGNNGSNDACGYNGADPESGASRDQKAKLTLSNGQELWDIAGNVWEWTDDYMVANEGPVDATPASEYIEYTNITQYKDFNYLKPPVDTWNSSQGMGTVYSDFDDGTALRGFIRGGYWNNGSNAGAFALNLNNPPTNTNASIGFRVAR